jgi:hypothetical protein
MLLVTFGLLGLLIGSVAGALTHLLRWNPVRTFLIALGVMLAALAVPELGNLLEFEDTLLTVVLAPLIAVVPVAAGFTAGRKMATVLARKD